MDKGTPGRIPKWKAFGEETVPRRPTLDGIMYLHPALIAEQPGIGIGSDWALHGREPVVESEGGQENF